MYVGGTYTGWTGYLIDKTDTTPLLTMERESNGNGGVWMKIYND